MRSVELVLVCEGRCETFTVCACAGFTLLLGAFLLVPSLILSSGGTAAMLVRFYEYAKIDKIFLVLTIRCGGNKSFF